MGENGDGWMEGMLEWKDGVTGGMEGRMGWKDGGEWG